MHRIQASVLFTHCVLLSACGGADPVSLEGTGGAPATGGAISVGSGGAIVASGGTTGSGGAVVGTGGVFGVGGAMGTGGAVPVLPPGDLSQTLVPLVIPPTDELTGICQSWTLGNDTPLFVNKIVETNAGGVHHSNWIWVADTQYAGPDGTWPCADRGFEQVSAAAFGGVFFAQSTQALTDTQEFPPGVAYQIPAHARIIGDVHLLNATPDEMTTNIHFEVYTIPMEEVVVELKPMAFTNTNLDIAPMTETHARMQCATPVPAFDIYYILPHFHSLGTRMRIDVAGGPMNGVEIYRSAATYGDSMGQMFDPPISVTGATGLAITCEYQNPRDARVGYGVGDQEMCVGLIYSSGPKAGGTTFGNLTAAQMGSIWTTDALCVGASTP